MYFFLPSLYQLFPRRIAQFFSKIKTTLINKPEKSHLFLVNSKYLYHIPIWNSTKVHLKKPFHIEIAAASYLWWTAINFDWQNLDQATDKALLWQLLRKNLSHDGFCYKVAYTIYKYNSKISHIDISDVKI